MLRPRLSIIREQLEFVGVFNIIKIESLLQLFFLSQFFRDEAGYKFWLVRFPYRRCSGKRILHLRHHLASFWLHVHGVKITLVNLLNPSLDMRHHVGELARWHLLLPLLVGRVACLELVVIHRLGQDVECVGVSGRLVGHNIVDFAEDVIVVAERIVSVITRKRRFLL